MMMQATGPLNRNLAQSAFGARCGTLPGPGEPTNVRLHPAYPRAALDYSLRFSLLSSRIIDRAR